MSDFDKVINSKIGNYYVSQHIGVTFFSIDYEDSSGQKYHLNWAPESGLSLGLIREFDAANYETVQSVEISEFPFDEFIQSISKDPFQAVRHKEIIDIIREEIDS